MCVISGGLCVLSLPYARVSMYKLPACLSTLSGSTSDGTWVDGVHQRSNSRHVDYGVCLTMSFAIMALCLDL